MSNVLAVDAGQTGIKLRHVDATGAREAALPGIRTDLPLGPQLAAVLGEAERRFGPAERIGVGVSGLTEGAVGAYELLARARVSARSLALAHDSVTGYLAALGEEPGAVVAAGTGVVTLAVGVAEVARVDGWGNIMGDVGSGHWIGRAALEAVMRAHDGRGPETALTDAVRAEFPDLEAAYILLQSDERRVGRVAGFARAVAALAESDAVAAAITDTAASELVCSVSAGLRRVGQDAAPRPQVRAIGGVFRSARLMRSFAAGMAERHPSAEVRIGAADALDGAVRLVAIGAGNPLRALVDRVATAEVGEPA
ncbi:N-acetylglucosamine kinase [Microbacterium sp.]|uniref:N-acetylglucosamine kinase n=1 Tax=Microbacterium sp. TaxID=51671 RepID=UPI002811170D|nr:BadF/BadG/BcrA/BcrD ATPase family protein [Microbacterium sp.]